MLSVSVCDDAFAPVTIYGPSSSREEYDWEEHDIVIFALCARFANVNGNLIIADFVESEHRRQPAEAVLLSQRKQLRIYTIYVFDF